MYCILDEHTSSGLFQFFFLKDSGKDQVKNILWFSQTFILWIKIHNILDDISK